MRTTFQYDLITITDRGERRETRMGEKLGLSINLVFRLIN